MKCSRCGRTIKVKDATYVAGTLLCPQCRQKLAKQIPSFGVTIATIVIGTLVFLFIVWILLESI